MIGAAPARAADLQARRRSGDTARSARTRRARRVPTVLQIEAVECGAASLAMVLAHHGRWEPLVKLRQMCGVSRDGSKASSIVRAARRLGLDAKGFRYEPDQLRPLPMPAIIFANMNHFMVLEGFSRGRVHVNDPAVGPLVLTHDEFDRIYSGVVLTFEPTGDFISSGGAPAILGPLLGRLTGAWGAAVLGVFAGALLVVPAILVPIFSRIFIDEVVIDAQRDWAPWLIAAMVAAVAVQVGLLLIQGRSGLGLRNRVAVAAAARYVWRILRLPVAFFSQRSPGNVSSRVDMSDRLAEHAGIQLPSIAVALVAMLLQAGIMLLYSPALTSLVVGLALAGALLFLMLQRRLTAFERKTAADVVKLGGRTMQGLATIEVLKASGAEDAFFEGWSGQHALVVNQHQNVGRLQAVFATAPEFLTQLGTMTVVALAGLFVMNGRLTLGMLVAFLALQAGFFGSMRILLGGLMQLSKARATLDQFDDVLDEAPAAEFKPAASHPLEDAPERADALGRVRKLQGQVDIRNLTFGYSPLEKPLIENFSVSLKPGSRVALVGGSGSGKSTVGRLISGLHTPWSGEILIDGRPLGEVPRALLRNSMAVVDQDLVIFSGTIRENIVLWDATMPEERVVQAAKDALLHDDIARRPGAYGGGVEEGGRNLSGGQRQRLEIARALVTDPSILVLDEATSALDPIVEKAVMDNIRRRGCTCIVIAHRLSTIRDCDEIIVMRQGVVVQRGTHAAMMGVEGPYRALIEMKD